MGYGRFTLCTYRNFKKTWESGILTIKEGKNWNWPEYITWALEIWINRNFGNFTVLILTKILSYFGNSKLVKNENWIISKRLGLTMIMLCSFERSGNGSLDLDFKTWKNLTYVRNNSFELKNKSYELCFDQKISSYYLWFPCEGEPSQLR